MKHLFILFLVAACASTPPKPVLSQTRDRLFPDGTYRHGIHLTLPSGSEQSFTGVAKMTPAQITVVGLAHFGTTLFRIVEDRKTGEVKPEMYQLALQKHEAEVLRFYEILRQVLLLPMSAPEKNKLRGKGDEVEVLLSAYDENRVPTKMQIRYPKFTVDVVVEEYGP